ncbi:hypothetical protein GB937_005231 [Aspergillus fischeri]|nr:hypothetical protein GB937_005231 [Aspergillus fischeri]
MPAHIVILKRSLGPYSRAIATPGLFHQSRLVVMLMLILDVQNEVLEADSVVLCELSPAKFKISRLPINRDYISDPGANWQATLLKVVMMVNPGMELRMQKSTIVLPTEASRELSESSNRMGECEKRTTESPHSQSDRDFVVNSPTK